MYDTLGLGVVIVDTCMKTDVRAARMRSENHFY